MKDASTFEATHWSTTLRTFRETQGLSKAKLAKISKVSVSTINRLETGDDTVAPEKLESLLGFIAGYRPSPWFGDLVTAITIGVDETALLTLGGNTPDQLERWGIDRSRSCESFRQKVEAHFNYAIPHAAVHFTVGNAETFWRWPELPYDLVFELGDDAFNDQVHPGDSHMSPWPDVEDDDLEEHLDELGSEIESIWEDEEWVEHIE